MILQWGLGEFICGSTAMASVGRPREREKGSDFGPFWDKHGARGRETLDRRVREREADGATTLYLPRNYFPTAPNSRKTHAPCISASVFVPLQYRMWTAGLLARAGLPCKDVPLSSILYAAQRTRTSVKINNTNMIVKVPLS